MVEPQAPSREQRGFLDTWLEESIEQELSNHGTPGSGATSDGPEATVGHQLFRMRRLGMTGLCLLIPSLKALTEDGVLSLPDSRTLLWWLGACKDTPLRLIVDEANRYLGVHPPPVELQSLLGVGNSEAALSFGAVSIAGPAPTLRDGEIASFVTRPLTAVPSTRQGLAPSPPRDGVDAAQAFVEDEPGTLQGQFAPDAEATPLTSDVLPSAPPTQTEQDLEPPPQTIPGRDPWAGFDGDTAPGAVPLPSTPSPQTPQVQPEAFAYHEPPTADLAPDEAGALPEAGAPDFPEPEEHTHLGDMTQGSTLPEIDWRQCHRDLTAAQGPKPLAVIERLFVNSYVPLSEAQQRGGISADAEATLRTWRASFERSYSEAFDALRVRGKRPTMVLDVPELAHRIARLHGARSVQLLLVDGLRYDLGQLVHERLRTLVGQQAALTERFVLWSALPTTTSIQLGLLGRGPAALREPLRSAETEVVVAHGRNASTIRRIKVGQREVLKLDLVEDRLSEPGPPVPERLAALAEEVAAALANHLLNLPRRTLVMLFGDHGFQLEPLGGGTSSSRHGGASPEEVLVPAFAWLVGSVH